MCREGPESPHAPRLLRWADRILVFLTRKSPQGRFIVGDLREECGGIARQRGKALAGLWIWGQVLAIGVPIALRTFARRPLAGGGGTMDSIAQDVRFALRSLRKRIWFTASAVIALGLGIAATTSMFSVVDGVLVRDLPFPNPGELVSLWTAVPEWRGKEGYDYLWDHMPFGWEEARDILE